MTVGTQNFLNCIYEGGRGRERGSKRVLWEVAREVVADSSSNHLEDRYNVAMWLFTPVVNCTGPHTTSWIQDLGLQ